MTFYRGQKVVCTDTFKKLSLVDWWQKFWHPYQEPIKGQIYTVSNIYSNDDGELHLELDEIPDDKSEIWMPGFFACGFRPAVERKTDISVFTAMLKPSKVRA